MHEIKRLSGAVRRCPVITTKCDAPTGRSSRVGRGEAIPDGNGTSDHRRRRRCEAHRPCQHCRVEQHGPDLTASAANHRPASGLAVLGITPLGSHSSEIGGLAAWNPRALTCLRALKGRGHRRRHQLRRHRHRPHGPSQAEAGHDAAPEESRRTCGRRRRPSQGLRPARAPVRHGDRTRQGQAGTD